MPQWMTHEVDELRFRELIPISHDDYLNESHWRVRLFLRIKDLDMRVAEQKARRS